MKLISFIVLFLFVTQAGAQTYYTTINSSNLEQNVRLKVQLPRNYKTNTHKRYPLVLTLDGSYLFEPVAGNVDFLSYWEEMPESIVVGIIHNNRNKETLYGEKNYLPILQGAGFFDFVGGELLPWLDSQYRIAPFNVIVGHDITANFLNFFLLKERPLFDAYISLSPELAPEMTERIPYAIQQLRQNIMYYQATSSSDVPELREDILKLNENLTALQNDSFYYSFSDFEKATHYTLVSRAIPQGLSYIFSAYSPINNREFHDDLLTIKESPYSYLKKKIKIVEELYGIEGQTSSNDFIAVADALYRRQDWSGLASLGKLGQEIYPDKVMGSYYLGISHHAQGNDRRALRILKNAMVLEEFANITKNMIIARCRLIEGDD
ncbi:MAG: alpha/beta hydrolase-fold protein [Leeuwenhoekiella sp.]